MNSFFFLFFHWIVGQPLFNLYYTDLPIEKNNDDLFEHDCLRVISVGIRYDQSIQMTSFCLSEDASLFDIEVDKTASNLTFKHLSTKKISAEQLYYWSAPIDTIEKYQDYLDTKSLNLEEEMFYNCTSGRFGRRCEYEFSFYIDQDSSLYENIFRFFDTVGYHRETMTCYEHLQCNRGSLTVCLDWRDICNGQIDCSNDGIDEKDCWQLETQECQEDERRCSNGQCIPILISKRELFDLVCLTLVEKVLAPGSPIYNCRNTYNLFDRCDDYICSTNALTSACDEKRESQLLSAIYSNTDGSLSKNCSLPLECLLDSSACREFCLESECIEMIEKNCPERFFYPDVPILFANIYFAYIRNDPVSPSICYNSTDYDHFFLHAQTFLMNHIRCVHIKEFSSRINVSHLSGAISVTIQHLYENLKRYHLHMNYTLEICNRSNMYQCIHSPKCIRRSRLLDGITDCPQMDDEIIPSIQITSITEYIDKNYFKCQSINKYVPHYSVDNKYCDCLEDDLGYCEDEHVGEYDLKRTVLFEYICDRFTELLPKLIEGNNHTDETECQRWECDNIYTHCNSEWNCLSGEDETDCSSYLTFRCSYKFHPCVSPQTYQLTCLPIEKINDGNIDCLSATDENILRYRNSHQYEQSTFYCINQSSHAFIPIHSLCNGIEDCEHGDDEVFCTTNRISPELRLCDFQKIRITTDVEEFLCRYNTMERTNYNIEFKIHSIDSQTENTEERLESSLSSTRLSSELQRQCHFSLPVRVWLDQKKQTSTFTCFCPPNYYGKTCQFQNQRTSLTLQFQTFSDSSKIVFLILVSLIDDSDEKLVHSYESFTYLAIRDCQNSFLLNLHYSTRPKNPSRQYFLRVDVYEKLSLYHRGSLLFPVEFPFLPVHRLAFLIDIPSNNTWMVNCQNRECDHGRCMKYWNQPSNVTFCQCDRGWRGKSCQISYHCECASDAQCLDVLSNGRSICLCPKNRFGSRCLISSTRCERKDNSTCFNGGECLVADDTNGMYEKFICRCKQGFSGNQCENIDNQLILSFDRQIPLSQSVFIHFIYMHFDRFRRSTSFKTIPLREDFLRIYRSQPYHMAFIELMNKYYYLVVVSKNEYKRGSLVNKRIGSSDRCPNVTELFNETVLRWPLIRRIKLYHLPCQNHSLNLSCFHDEVHICLCYQFYDKRLSNCFRFDHNETYDCFGRSACEGKSRCVQDDEFCPKQSMCVCEDCFFGRQCQFRTDQFGLSLDAILGYQIVPIPSLSLQPLIIKLSFALTTVLMLIGLVNGFLSLITFANKSIHEVGCGFYLLGTSITTLFIMILFSFKFLVLLLTHMTIISNQLFLQIQCYSLDFLIRVCLCLEQWLTACVACERAVCVIQGTRFVKRKSKEIAKKVIVLLVTVVMVTFVHDPLSRDLTNGNDDEDNYEVKRNWCIVRYQSGVEIYNYIVQTFHFIGPFLVNLISSVILIVNRSRQSAITNVNRSFQLILREQLGEYKHILIGPCVLVILAIPRLLLIYTSKCMKSALDDVWFYLLGYFISFIPSMLTFLIFILPSKFYKKQFKKTISRYWKTLGKKIHFDCLLAIF